MKEIVFTSNIDGKDYSPEEITRIFNDYKKANNKGFKVVKVLGKYLPNIKRVWSMAFDKEAKIRRIKEDVSKEKVAIAQMDIAREAYGKETKAAQVMEEAIKTSLNKIYKLQIKEAKLRVALQKRNVYVGRSIGLKEALERYWGVETSFRGKTEEGPRVPDFKQQEEADIAALHRELDEIIAQSQEEKQKDQEQQPLFNVTDKRSKFAQETFEQIKREQEAKLRKEREQEQQVKEQQEQQKIEQKQRELLTSEARIEQEQIDEHSLDDVFLDLTKNMQELGNLISNVKSEVENQKSIAENEAREKEKLQKELDEMKSLGQSKEELDKRNNELETREKEVTTKEENLNNQTNELNNRENRLNERESNLNEREKAILNREKEFLGKISDFSNMVKSVNENLKTQTDVKEFVKK